MKEKIIYSSIFFLTFVLVTGVIIYLNSIYQNIFQFNFTLKSNIVNTDSTSSNSYNDMNADYLNTGIPNETEKKDSTMVPSISNDKNTFVKGSSNDNLNIDAKLDTAHQTVENYKENPSNNIASESSNIYQLQTQDTEQLSIRQSNKQLSFSKDYTEWIKKVSKIYSAMEPKKAAKIIQTYSDNVARDILYNMNKKTAAKVVSEFNPETANRIIRFE